MLQDQTLTDIPDGGAGSEGQLSAFLELTGFSLKFDIPLTIGATLLFILYFHIWSKTANSETPVDLRSRFPTACVRAVLFFLALFAFCYFANISIWVVFATVVVVGVVISALALDNMGLELILVVSIAALREACFGFPTLIHHGVPTEETQPNPKNELIGLSGIATSPLRPSGYILINGEEQPAASESGEMIDAGTKVVVTGIRNGQLRVGADSLES